MASIALVALTILYDELGAHRGHWFVRNAVNAAGFTSFEVGAALVAGQSPHFFSYFSLPTLLIQFPILTLYVL